VEYAKGFILIELIVVSSIIGILAAIVVLKYILYVEEAMEKVCRVNCM
jgi:prepilin-type N-terminal cleavage/methylation domain-containing protein